MTKDEIEELEVLNAYEDVWRDLCYLKQALSDYSDTLTRFFCVDGVLTLDNSAAGEELIVTLGVIRKGIHLSEEALDDMRKGVYDD